MTLRILILFLCALSAWAAEPPASDLQIESRLRERLAKSVIGKDGFVPKVKDGVVYWSGATSVAQHKGAATRMAKSAGARRVVNNIRFTGAKSSERAEEHVPDSAAPSAKPGGAKPVNKPDAAPVPKQEGALPPSTAASPKRATVQWVPVQH